MSDSEQALEVAAIDVENAAELLGFATAAAFGKWRDDESVRLTKTRQMTVQSSGDIPLFLDGEKSESRQDRGNHFRTERSECDGPGKLEHEVFVRSEILRERQSLRFYSAVTDRRGQSLTNHFSSLKATKAKGGK
jgi:hypothetical protein